MDPLGWLAVLIVGLLGWVVYWMLREAGEGEDEPQGY